MTNDVSEQLDISSEELDFIRADLASKPLLQPICHRFTASGADWSEAKEEARLSALVPALSRLGFDVDTPGGALAVEAWELARPSEEWSARTVPKLCAIADEAGFDYDGWTWEPSGRPSYLKRVVEASVIWAPLLAIWLAFEAGLTFWGEVRRGSPFDVGVRIVAVTLFIATASLLISAYLEWQERRKYR